MLPTVIHCAGLAVGVPPCGRLFDFWTASFYQHKTKEKGTERCLFLLLPRYLAMPNAARCGGVFRFAPCVAGTCGSPTHAPSLFCDTIQFAIETDLSCHRQGPGAELRSGLFSLPQICAPVPADPNLPGSKKAPERVSSFGLYHRLPQDSPSRIRAAERHTKALHSSLFSLHSPSSAPFSLRSGQKNKNIFCFLVT